MGFHDPKNLSRGFPTKHSSRKEEAIAVDRDLELT